MLSLRYSATPAARALRQWASSYLLPAFVLIAAGCNRLHPRAPGEAVYVMATQTFLRDRVAPVSNRVAAVQNGQKLTVLERGRRFIKVRTDKGETGWIEERAVVPPTVVAGFQDLAKKHATDPVVATAVLRDELYMHLQPGRETARFYLLPENEKLQLLVRASVAKPQPPQATPSLTHRARVGAGAQHHPSMTDKGSRAVAPQTARSSGVAPGGDHSLQGNPEEPPPMQDWWLCRDSHGRVGWLLAHQMDVDVPDAIAGYSEGQKMVGAYVLAKVTDEESTAPDKQVAEYVTVLSPYKDGLPYDFDQVRIFTWNIRKHRYETAYRQRNLQGYLPVVVTVQTLDKQGPVPTFQFKQGLGDAVVTDPETGAVRAAQTETETYRLDGVIVKKVVPATSTASQPKSAEATAPVDHLKHHRRRAPARAKGESARHRRKS